MELRPNIKRLLIRKQRHGGAGQRWSCPGVVALLVVFAANSAASTPLDVVSTVHDQWSRLAWSAAKETVKAVKRSTHVELVIEDVPMETFQVFGGRQHVLGVEVDGMNYEVRLGNEQELLHQARAAAATAPPAADPHAPQHAYLHALPGGGGSGSSGSRALVGPERGGEGPLVPKEHFGGRRGAASLELPHVTLSGPLELVLDEPEQVNIFTPHAADVGGPVRRLLVEAGATVRVSGLQRVALRRPVDLPRLPGQYLAEVYATLQLGQPEEGFQFAPGIMYLAAQLRKQAASRGDAPPLLSFDVQSVTRGSLTLASAHEGLGRGGQLPPKLKVRRLPGGTVELTLRQGQVTPLEPEGELNAAALAHMWAWPLPHTDTSSWLPYEQVLRSVLAAHPFNVDAIIKRGIGLRLTKSTIQGVHLVAFDMAVRAHEPRQAEDEDSPFQTNENPLEVWEAVVQVQPREPDAAGGSAASGSTSLPYHFVPLHVKRKHRYGNTLTLSRSAVLAALAADNRTAPGDANGYQQLDQGLELLAAYLPPGYLPGGQGGQGAEQEEGEL